MDIRSFDHVAICVRSIREAAKFFIDTLGGEFIHGGDDEPRAMRDIQFWLGGRKLELLQPLSPDCHLHRFLDRFGEGMHHMTLLVPDVEVAARELTEQGYELVDLDVRYDGWREVYLRPKGTFGTLIQIADTPHDWDRPRADCTLEEVVNGQFIWQGRDLVRRTPDMGLPLDQR